MLSRSQHEEAILNVLQSGEMGPYEIANDLVDIASSIETRKLIVEMVVDRKLELTPELYVRIPSPVSSASPTNR